jgi:hypothetical protein
VCIHVHMYVCVGIYLYAHTPTHTYTHTHTHTHAPTPTPTGHQEAYTFAGIPRTSNDSWVHSGHWGARNTRVGTSKWPTCGTSRRSKPSPFLEFVTGIAGRRGDTNSIKRFYSEFVQANLFIVNLCRHPYHAFANLFVGTYVLSL